MRAVPLAGTALVFIAACSQTPPAPDHAAQLAACRRVSIDGDALGRCLFIKYRWAPADAGPAKAAWQRHLDSLRAGPAEPPPPSAEQEDALARRWADCVFRETGGDWEKQSVATFNCRSDLPDVDALIRYGKTLRADSSRLLFEVYSAVER